MISVIMPSYNHGKYLSHAIESVLQQTYPAQQVIVVDDGSTDNTPEIVKPYLPQITYLHQNNSGISAARNTGIQHAKGKYLAFLDADDKWPIDKLQSQVQALEQDTTLDMVFGLVQQFYCPTISVEAKAKLQCPTALIPGVIASTMLIKTDSFYKVGLFDQQWNTGEFIAWYIKAKTTGLNEIMLDDILLYRRIHDGHLHTRSNRNYQHYLHILRAKLHNQNNTVNE
jgi:glycosyltransferase involved in cell wall biosynthesis